MFQARCGPVFRPRQQSNCSPLWTLNQTRKSRSNVLLLVAAIAAKEGADSVPEPAPMRHRIPCRSRPQSHADPLRNPPLFRCAICAQCRAQSVALPPCYPFIIPCRIRSRSRLQSRTIGGNGINPNPGVVRTASSCNAAAKRKTASGVRDQENSR